MERIPTTPPTIAPLSSHHKRPLWSVMIPVHNCSHFLAETLKSVLNQDQGEFDMQIEVVDDASSDADVEALVKQIGQGRVSYFCQPTNVGSLRNFETCINRAKGHLVHLLHGDDRLEPGFYNKMSQIFKQFPEAGAAFCNYSFINEYGKKTHVNPAEAKKDGILTNWLLRIAEQQRIQYVAMVVRREVYENLGGFYGVNYGEDWEMWVRIAKHFPIAYTPKVLASYRGHKGSLSWEKAVAGRIFQDLLDAIQLIEKHVPEPNRKKLASRSKRHCALYLIGVANGIWKDSHNWSSTQYQVKQALAFSKKPRIVYRVLKLYLKVIINTLFHYVNPYSKYNLDTEIALKKS